MAKWDGSGWSGFADFFGWNPGPAVFELCVFDDGSGEALYGAGDFLAATLVPPPGGATVRGVMKWDGQQVHALDFGLTKWGGRAIGKALAVFDDGTGEALYVGGDFDWAGGVDAYGIARWGCLRGDLNCDTVVNSFDIDPFVLAISDPNAYGNAYPDCDVWRADINADGLVNAFDIDPFVALLIGP